MKPIIITITGPSLTGKTTLANNLQRNPLFQEAVSTTTRTIREGEIDGVHYNFVDNDTFLKMKENDLLIEEVQVNGKYYGISKEAVQKVLDSGKNAMIVVEPHGARQVEKYANENGIGIYKVFICNDQKVLLKRFKERFDNDSKATEETYKNRLWGMIMEEPYNWVLPALHKKDRYDVVLDSFTESNLDSTVTYISEQVYNKLRKQNIRIVSSNRKIKP